MKYNLQQGKLKIVRLINNNMSDKAIRLCKSMLKHYKDKDLLFTLATLYIQNGNTTGYESTRKMIIKYFSGHPSTHKQIASLLLKHNLTQLAIEEYKTAIDKHSDDDSLYECLATLYLNTRQYRNAITLLNDAVVIFPDSSKLFLILGACYMSIQDIDNAEEYFRMAYAISNDNIEAVSGISNILFLRKQYDQALDLLIPILKLKNPPFSATLVYSQISSVTDNQQSAIEKLHTTPDSRLTHIEQISKYFALGRLKDETGDYKNAFDNYLLGNRLCNQTYNVKSYDRLFERIIECFTSDTIEKLKRSAKDSRRLVFIVGMPRSGSSLLEQILSCHPYIYGAGEINTLDEIVKLLPARRNLSTSFPELLYEMDTEIIDSIARQYIDHIESINQDSLFVTDKMPDNFLYLGLINIMFPEARVIHITRNQYDTCLSCYFQNFSGHYPYAYDLNNLFHYYNNYKTLMDHWVNNLSIKIYNVKYEDLVLASEHTIKNILDFFDLEFSDNCLDFDKSIRPVTTSSAHQTNKPLYYKSINRWNRYRQYAGQVFDIP